MRIDRRLLIGGLMLGTILPVTAASPRKRPLVLAHRGASALLPEHTLEAYRRAIADGADHIEPDLVMTRNGVLVARHENDLSDTTDVAWHAVFAKHRRAATIDGQVRQGWFAEDFTLAELKTLRAIERVPEMRPGNRRHDGQFAIPTWDEIVDLAAAEAARLGRPIGLVPELKHSTYLGVVGLPPEIPFLASLSSHPYLRTAPIIIQSFEVANLRDMRARIGRPRNIALLQLLWIDGRPADIAAADGALTYGAMQAPGGLRDIAAYADIIGPHKAMILPPEGPPTTLVSDAHAAGLRVMPYTFRPENAELPADLRDDTGRFTRNPAGSIAEIRRFLDTGIDGFFTDDPAIGRAAVDGWTRSPPQR